MRFSKRASLDLSINAIVILVLAIAMLGLGLGFTKGMFAKFSSKLDVPPPNIPATAEEPVVLPQEELEVKHDKDFAFSVNFYNDFATTWVTPVMKCSILGLDSSSTKPNVLTSSQAVEGGKYQGFKFIIQGSATTGKTGTTDICTLTFYVCTKPTTGTSLNCIITGTSATTTFQTKQVTIKVT